MNEVLWTDVAPRDGLQNIADTISTDAKIRLVRGLLDAGVPRVEATSFVSPTWVPQLADAPAVLAGLHDATAQLARAHPESPWTRARTGARPPQCARHHRRDRLIQSAQRQSQRCTNRSTTSRTSSSSQASAAARLMLPISVSFGCPFEGTVAPARVVELCADLVATRRGRGGYRRHDRRGDACGRHRDVCARGGGGSDGSAFAARA